MTTHKNALPSGTVLNQYKIESLLAHGGFGIVYLARHAHLDELVVIKEYLPSEVATREGTTVHALSNSEQEDYQEGLDRFLDEAKQLVQFKSHKNIVSCRDFFADNGTAYLVMDYEDGVSLSDLLKMRHGNQLNEQELIRIMLPLLDGLKFVHDKGVLHRDIKPGNIFIRRTDEQPVLIDFGAAKQNFSKHSKSMAPYSPGYAAMEQVEEDGYLGPWTDLYAIGAVMWRVLFGDQQAESGAQDTPNPAKVESRANARVRGNKDPLRPAMELGRGHFSDALLTIIDKCLALNEQDRYQTTGALMSALEAVRDGRETGDTPEPQINSRPESVIQPEPRAASSSRSKNSFAIVAMVLVLLITGGAGAFFYLQESNKAVMTVSSIPSGVDVYLDGKKVGTTPYNKSELSPGQHKLKLDHPEYVTKTVTITLSNEQAWTKNFTLDRAQSTVVVSSDPVGASIYVDGRDTGKVTPFTLKGIKAGSHVITLKKSGYKDSDRTTIVHTVKGKEQKLQLLLSKLPKIIDRGLKELKSAEYYLFQLGETQKAIPKFRQAARKGNSMAIAYLAYLYKYRNLGVPRDTQKSERLGAKGYKGLKVLVKQGDYRAYYYMGILYQNGVHVSKDFAKALSLFEKSAASGFGVAQNELGLIYRIGYGAPKDKRKALSWYKKAAGQGYAAAQNRVGLMYDNGEGVSRSYSSAVRWYRKAANQKHKAAEYNLGVKYKNGQGVPKDLQQTIYWYNRSANQGYASAQNSLGFMYLEGTGGPKNYNKAARLFEAAALQGHVSAQNNLGYMYRNGHGVAKNINSAIKWYKKAAEKKNSTAEFNLGYLYLQGLTGRKDYDKAMEWFKRSAANGYASAAVQVARLYETGGGSITKNKYSAARWYKKGAELGNTEAQYKTGRLYSKGIGHSQSDRNAVKWYKKAALQGHAKAQNGLGVKYATGKGVGRDYSEAVRWYKKAANQGNRSAQYNLAAKYEKGLGTTRSRYDAIIWYRKAAKSGHRKSQQALRRMGKSW